MHMNMILSVFKSRDIHYLSNTYDTKNIVVIFPVKEITPLKYCYHLIFTLNLKVPNA